MIEFSYFEIISYWIKLTFKITIKIRYNSVNGENYDKARQ